jgi:hypothetical protein
MDGEIIEAVLKAALPLGVLSYFLFHWSLKAGRLEGAGGRKAFKAEMKAMKKSAKKKKARSRNPVHNKWMKFGGGFYGLVGIWTFLVVEVLEVYDFATGYRGMNGLVETLSTTSFISLAVDFFINSIMNFVTAIAWPAYWPDVLSSENIWIWLFAAYGGYWIGMKIARGRTNTKKTL